MEVGHPPGAPIFMLTANLFSQFTSDPTKVAMMVNTMSALLSALCILFHFWSITMLTRKLVAGTKEPDLWQMIQVLYEPRLSYATRSYQRYIIAILYQS